MWVPLAEAVRGKQKMTLLRYGLMRNTQKHRCSGRLFWAHMLKADLAGGRETDPGTVQFYPCLAQQLARELTGGRKAVRGQDSSSCSCREQPLLGSAPPLLLGMLLLRRRWLPKGSSAIAEACRTAQSRPDTSNADGVHGLSRAFGITQQLD